MVGPLAGYDKIILWVRDLTQPNITDNVPVLVCIYTRSARLLPSRSMSGVATASTATTAIRSMAGPPGNEPTWKEFAH